MRLFTYVLSSGSLQINNTDGVVAFTIQANASSSCTLSGNISFKGLNSTAVTFDAGESYTQTALANSPIDGVTITWVSGTVDIIISF